MPNACKTHCGNVASSLCNWHLWPPKKVGPLTLFLSRSGARRLLLLYAPSGPFAWALHWIFFFFLIAIATGLIRGLFHVAYLRPSILVPLLIGDFVLALLVRLASFYVDRAKTGRQMPAASTGGTRLLRREVSSPCAESPTLESSVGRQI